MTPKKQTVSDEDVLTLVTVTHITPAPQRQDDGTFLRMLNVEFKVGPYGPFSQQVPFEDFDEEAVMEKVLVFARKIVKIHQMLL